jgi:hypothetical protein
MSSGLAKMHEVVDGYAERGSSKWTKQDVEDFCSKHDAFLNSGAPDSSRCSSGSGDQESWLREVINNIRFILYTMAVYSNFEAMDGDELYWQELRNTTRSSS